VPFAAAAGNNNGGTTTARQRLLAKTETLISCMAPMTLGMRKYVGDRDRDAHQGQDGMKGMMAGVNMDKCADDDKDGEDELASPVLYPIKKKKRGLSQTNNNGTQDFRNDFSSDGDDDDDSCMVHTEDDCTSWNETGSLHNNYLGAPGGTTPRPL